MGDDDPDRLPPHEQRHVEPGRRSDLPGELLVDLGVVEQRVDAFASPPLEDPRALRGVGHLVPDEPLRAGACCGLHDEPAAARKRDEDVLGVDQALEPVGHELQHAGQLDHPRERVADLDQRLELPGPARRRLVQPRVLDGDRGLRREQRDHVDVLFGELSVALLGQVQVPVGDAAEHDRHAEEARHRWVVRREARRVRMVGEVGKAKWLRVADQHAEDASPARPLADQPLGVRVDAGDEEALEPCSRRIDHPERGVAGVGQLGRRLGDALEHRVERELAADGDACLDQRAEALLHGAIIRRTTKGGRSRPSVASGVAAQLMATAVFCGAT